jgi:hypothetical protein
MERENGHTSLWWSCQSPFACTAKLGAGPPHRCVAELGMAATLGRMAELGMAFTCRRAAGSNGALVCGDTAATGMALARGWMRALETASVCGPDGVTQLVGVGELVPTRGG